MRLRRGLIIGLVAAVTALQAAAAAETSTVRLLVTVRASVTKQWTYTRVTRSDGCTSTVKGGGTRAIAIRSSDASIMTASWPRTSARVTFSAPVRLLAGTVNQSGTKTTRIGGSGCDTGTHKITCLRVRRSFRNQTVQLVSRRAHRLGFRRMTGLVSDAFFNRCPGEPSAVRALSGGIELADATFSERDLFDRTTAGVTLQGSADVTTKLLKSPGNVIQRVRWTLTLRRLGA
jgi:hypothetical protein